MELKTVLGERYVCDLKKPDIDKFERAEIIQHILDEKDLSIRQFAKDYGFNYSTVQDWLLWNRITPKEYVELKQQGMTHTQVYRQLRNDQGFKPSKYIEKLVIDKKIINFTQYLNTFCRHNDNIAYSEDTLNLIDKLERSIKRTIFKIEHKMENGE